MLSLQAITPEPTTSSALVSSAIRTPQLEIRARAAASTIVRGNRAGGGVRVLPMAWIHKHSAKCRHGCADACPLTVLSSIFPKRFGNYLCLQYIFRINKVKRQSNK